MDKEKNNTLPNNWILTTIGEIGIVVSGGTPSTRQPDFWGGEIAWITPADLSNYKNKDIQKGKRNITKIGLDNSSAKLLPKGSIMFSSRAPIGYTVIAKNEISTNQGFKNLVPTNSGYSDYIYYYLLSSKQLAESYASGTTFLELSATKFSRIPFPLPPIAEQHRIVEKIEELFSELDKAQESILNAQKQLEIYRQVVLIDAFEGKFLKHKNIKYWVSSKIKEIGNVTSGGTPSRNNSDYYNGNILWIKSGELKYNIIIDSEEKITNEAISNSNTKLISKGSVLIALYGATVGKLAILGNDACTNQAVASITLYDIVHNKYLYYFFLKNKEKLLQSRKGGAQLNISQSIINDFIIIYPDLKEQINIVQEIEYRFTLIENLENSIIENLKRIEIYRQIILQKAFSGNLVPQYETDEPACELLKRITEEIKVYQIRQKEIAKNKPQKLVFMESNKTVKEILEEATHPMEANEIWQKSIHKDDIEKFYEELKKISTNIEEIREGKISKLSLKK